MTLSDGTIRLRALEPEDLDWIYRIENDSTLWKWSRANVPYSAYVLKKYIADNQYDIYTDGQVRMAVERISDGQTIGCVDLVDFSPRHLRAEIGLVIFPQYQSMGYGRMVMDVVCDYARRHLHLHQLYAQISVKNMPACRLFDALGFQRNAVMKEWLNEGKDGFSDVYLFQKVL